MRNEWEEENEISKVRAKMCEKTKKKVFQGYFLKGKCGVSAVKQTVGCNPLWDKNHTTLVTRNKSNYDRNLKLRRNVLYYRAWSAIVKTHFLIY